MKTFDSKLSVTDIPVYPTVTSLRRECIENILGEPVSESLVQVLNSVTQNQIALNSVDRLTATELRSYLEPILNALKKIEFQLEAMPNNESILLDQYYAAATELRSNRFDVDVHAMKEAADKFIKQNQSGGKGPEKNYDYTRNIKAIAEVIESHQNLNISANPNSPFHRLILYWFNEFLEIDLNNVSRHIETMLEESK